MLLKKKSEFRDRDTGLQEIQDCQYTKKNAHCDLQIITSSHNMAEIMMSVSAKLSTLNVLQ